MSLSFEKVETGRTHATQGGIVPIEDADGNPESEYVLYANVDGAKIRLLSKPSGLVEQEVQRQKERADEDDDDAGAYIEDDPEQS